MSEFEVKSVSDIGFTGEDDVKEASTPFEEYIVRRKQNHGQRADTTAMTLAKSGAPIENAEHAQIARDYTSEVNPAATAPNSVVKLNKDRMKADIEMRRNATMLSTSPMLMRWLKNPANAEVASDDVSTMANIEAGLKTIGRTLEASALSLGQSYRQLQSDIALDARENRGKSFLDQYNENRGAQQTQREANNALYPWVGDMFDKLGMSSDNDGSAATAAIDAAFGSWVDFGMDTVSKTSGDFNQTKGALLDTALVAQMQAHENRLAIEELDFSDMTAENLRRFDPVDGVPLDAQQALSGFIQLASEDPVGLIVMGLELGGRSLGSMAAAATTLAATRSPRAALAASGITSYMIETSSAILEEIADAGIDIEDADSIRTALSNPEVMAELGKKGHIKALIISLTDMVAGGVATKALFKSPILNLIAQTGVQGTAGGVGEAAGQAATEDEIDFGQVALEVIGEAGGAVVDVGVLGRDAARKIKEDRYKAAQAETHEKSMQEIAKSAEASKVRDRTPEQFGDFVKQSTEGTDVENIYVDPEGFIKLFQDQGVPIEAIPDLLPGVDLAQLKRAQATGEDVVVPTSTYMEKIAGSEFDAGFVDISKFALEGMTPQQAREFNETVNDAEVQADIADMVAAENFQIETASEQRIFDNINDQLVEAGRSRAAAAQEATVYPAFYRTMAERAGITIDEMVDIYPIPQIRGAQPAAVVEARIDQLDRDVAALQARFNSNEIEETANKEYIDALEEAVKRNGLDPAKVTADQIREMGDKFQQSVQKIITETPEFRAWFGDSKVVDESGEPLVVYHGTNANAYSEGSFSVFSTRGERGGAFFTSDKATANAYGEEVYATYVDMKDPMIVYADGAGWSNIGRGARIEGDKRPAPQKTSQEDLDLLFALYDDLIGGIEPLNTDNTPPIDPDTLEGIGLEHADIDGIAKAVRRLGYDGLIVRDVRDGPVSDSVQNVADTYVAFGATQIKSVDNKGAFDPNDPNIFNQSGVEQTETQAFKDWFGDSKVVDENGDPLVTYHGSEASFDAFDVSKIGQHGTSEGYGFYFAVDKDTAKGYVDERAGGGELKETYLKMEKPLDVNEPNFNASDIEAIVKHVVHAEVRDSEGDIEDYKDGFMSNYVDTYSMGEVDAISEVASTLTEGNETATDFIAEVSNASGAKTPVFEAVRDVTGHDGIISDGFSGEGKGGGTIYVAWFPEQIKSVDNQGTFDPTDPNIFKQGEDDKRGQIQIPAGGPQNGEAIIDLFQNADLSTFLHESSHFFLTIVQDMAAQENAPKAVTDMLDTTKKWWKDNLKDIATEAKVSQKDTLKYINDGTTGDTAKDAKLNTATQEQWARAFETYLLTGKAPNTKLRAAFEQFRAWLMEVYRKVRGDLNVNVSDDIRQVFDMLLATDEEIKEANVDNSGDMIAATAAELGVSEEDYAKLAELHQEAQDQSAAQTINAAMRPIRQMRDKKYKARKDVIREGVTKEVNARKVFRAIEWMGNKRWLGDDDVSLPKGMRLNKDQLRERYGAGIFKTLPRGSFRVYTPDGTDIDEAAGWFGFGSGDEMVQAMEAAKVNPRKKVIEDETDARALAELDKDEAIVTAADEATEAFHSDKRGDYIAAELRTMNKALGRDKTISTASYARELARRTINTMRTRDAVAINRYLVAERRAAESAQASFAKGDKEAAANFKRQQLFNHMMYVQAKKVKDEVMKMENLAKRLQSKGTRKNLANEYLGAIDDVLEQYDFRKIGRGKEARRERMLAYVQMMVDAGRENEIAIPAHILENARAEPYMTLPVERLRGVHATLKNIESTARRAQKLIDKNNEREMDNVVNDIGDAFAENVNPKAEDRVESKGARLKTGARQFMNLVLKADTLLDKVDGYKGEGAAYDNLKKDLDAATSRLQVRRREAAESLEGLYDVYSVKERNDMAVRKVIPVLNTSMSKWDMIAIVLNTGNEDNIQRLTDRKVKGSFTQAQVDAVVDMMDKRDLDFVQSVWDYIGSYWGEIAARELRTTGVSPERVIAQELQTQHGTYKGGYYPLKYDPRASGGRNIAEGADDVMRNMQGGMFGKAQTRNGHTKERGLSSGKPILLDIGVLHGHINSVLHDLELSEPVTNAWRILQDPRVKELFYSYGLRVDHQSLEMWVQDVASGQVNSSDGFSRGVRLLKSGFTVSKLALNLSTAAVQVTGIGQSMVVLGKKNFALGAVEYLKNPHLASVTVKEMSEYMREREKTFNKDIYDMMGDVKVGPKAGKVKRFRDKFLEPFMFMFMTKSQFYAVDMPTWIGAYNKALKDGKTDDEAIVFADRLVDTAQGTGTFSHRSAIERGTLNATTRQNDLLRLFTTLGSYMFAKANVAYIRTGQTNFRSPIEILSYTVDMALLFTMEAVLYAAIKGTLPGGDDEDEDADGWAEFLAKETALSIVSTIPFARDLGSAFRGFDSGGTYGSILDNLTKPLMAMSDGKFTKTDAKAIIDTGGMFLHLPSTQINRILDAGVRQIDGEDVSPIEYIMGRR